MADNESDLETEGLELALDTLCDRYCIDEEILNSKAYCSGFCELVEEYTGQWHVPLPQLKVLRTALSSFTKATAAFPDDCQHIHYVLSSMALSFFELMLFFSKEEFVEEPLKDILDSFQGCHAQLLRHRNSSLQHVKQVIKAGGPWENPVLQGILKEVEFPQNDVENYLGAEPPVFLELRVRYLQACEKLQEAMALSKSCLENPEAGKHLYFHQAYLTCLYKASLHEHLHKEMAEIDGRDAVEIICNTESVEKDELLLSLCKVFLTQQLQNGDMYYIWDLVFVWSRLYLRAHPSRQGFLSECLKLASSATNVRAIFPFIKLVTAELGSDGVQVCVELCARALQLCDNQADALTQSLVCKTIAFLLPHDLEICRACALLVFCQERSLEAYRTVCLLYKHPDQEPHPHNSPVRTCVRFHIVQMLKERLCFDPEFWNLLTLRTHCLELMHDTVMKAVVLNEMKEEEEKRRNEELLSTCVNDFCIQSVNTCQQTDAQTKIQGEKQSEMETKSTSPTPKASLLTRNLSKKLRRRKRSISYEELEHSDDPEVIYEIKTTSSLANKPVYSLRRNHSHLDNSGTKLSLNNKRECLSRCVKSQIFKRKGQKRWFQGVSRLDQVQVQVKVQNKKEKNLTNGIQKKRGRKPLSKLELSYPDNEIYLSKEECGYRTTADVEEPGLYHLQNQLQDKHSQGKIQQTQGNEGEENIDHTTLLRDDDLHEQTSEETTLHSKSEPSEAFPRELQAADPSDEANLELEGPSFELLGCPVGIFHSYSLQSKSAENASPPESTEPEPPKEPEPVVTEEISNSQGKVKRTWKEKVLRSQKYGHIWHHCNFCHKDYKGLNVLRHALAHLRNLRSKKHRCILCEKCFNQFAVAKKHILEHINTMCKEIPHDRKQCEACTLAPKKSVQKVCTKLAKCVQSSSETHKETQISVSNDQNPEQKPRGKVQVASLSREERIVRNARHLIRKTSVSHKRHKESDTNTSKPLDLKNEQFVIKDDLLIVKHPTGMEEEDGGDLPAGENGHSVDMMFYLCPSESCDKLFIKPSGNLTKHALKCHIDDEKVLEKTFVLDKHKCTFCPRKIQFLQHYKDHMKLHGSPPRYFCYHFECNLRFLTHHELKDHIHTHQPLTPQCLFTACEKLFPNIQSLHDHEWRHYIPVPKRNELEGRQSNQTDEAPWKQKVKVEEVWLKNKKEKDSPTLCEVSNFQASQEMNKTEASEVSTSDVSETIATPDNCVQTSLDIMDNSNILNGIEGEKINSTDPSVSTHSKKACKDTLTKSADEGELIDISLSDSTGMFGEINAKIVEANISEHKSFKPENSNYGGRVKGPFMRPPASSYLNESLLSMRKRRLTEESPPKKYLHWTQKNKKEPEPVKEEPAKDVVPEQKVRHRCDKCLSSFSTLEDLQKHQALNTCSSLFGFDSDDES
ncbi:uncharacterized protein znf654 [Gouania willdenowi]|uniref:uncharacterized protein znf654 n=1 Tax=Gouania willdenowi TaxID=441366 RepID=UPI001054D1E0|nr:zinc finger protein 654 [Gouania willdenowi]